ncbi:MFS transporter [Campylobacter ureolyticus]|uniref:MFS transporter n=1 Tax=Campylobacter ureolyticus TaxID=827 RepID=UPI0026EEA4E4|nr:MFS transporter [Campylobacter ureolyticus]
MNKLKPLASFKFKNFKIYWIGMNVSLIGSWMQSIAQPWLALSITNNALLVSLVAVAQFLPPLFLTLISGALVDKFDTRKLLFISQTGLMIVAILFTLMMTMFEISFLMIMVLSFLNGIFLSIDAPARQSFVYETIEDDKFIPNAVALNSMSFNVARILGPGLAGLVIASFGIEYCFLINSVSFAAIIVSLFFIKNRRILSKNRSKNMLYSIRDGLIYAKNNHIISSMLYLLLIMALFLPHYNVTISALAKFELNGNEKTFGYLMSFLGIGSFLGALFIASFGKLNFKMIFAAPILASVFLILTGFSSNFYISGLFLLMTGFFFVVASSSINSTIQLKTKNEYRGRVMSIYSLFFQGSIPFGAIYSGALVDSFKPRCGILMCALSAIICIILLVRFKKVLFWKV